MKPCIILALLIPVATVTMAQESSISAGVKKKLAELNRSNPVQKDYGTIPVMPLQDTGKTDPFRKLLEAKRLQQGGLVTATFSHTTARGKVYRLTPDNMPCLVPDRKAVAPMPIHKGWEPDERMNAWPKQEIIPQEAQKGNKAPRH